MDPNEFAKGSPDSPESNSADHREEQQAARPDFGDCLFDIDPRPCIPIFFPRGHIKPPGMVPAGRKLSPSKNTRRYVRTSLREALHWSAIISGCPITVSTVEDAMWRHHLAESDIFIDTYIYRHSGFNVLDDKERARQITKVSAALTGVAYDPADDEYPGELFIRLPPRFVHEGKTKDLADVLGWAAQTWGLLGTEHEDECRASIASARGLRHPVGQFRDGTFEVPRLPLPVWRGIHALLLPKPTPCDLGF